MRAPDNTIKSHPSKANPSSQFDTLQLLFAYRCILGLISLFRKAIKLCKSTTFVKNSILSGVAALIGHLIGSLELAILMVFITTLCEELYDSLDAKHAYLSSIFCILKDRFFNKGGSSAMPLNRVSYVVEEPCPIYEEEATVMFTDIRGFSALSEQMHPSDVFRFIKNYMDHMLPIINRNGGIVNQVQGDGILSIFHNSPENAIEAAIEMQEAIDKLNVEEELSLSVGMGIATGTIVGGKLDHHDGRVLITSDTVNTAKYLEEMTKQFYSNILVCDRTLSECCGDFEIEKHALGSYTWKGKRNGIHIHALSRRSSMADKCYNDTSNMKTH